MGYTVGISNSIKKNYRIGARCSETSLTKPSDYNNQRIAFSGNLDFLDKGHGDNFQDASTYSGAWIQNSTVCFLTIDQDSLLTIDFGSGSIPSWGSDGDVRVIRVLANTSTDYSGQVSIIDDPANETITLTLPGDYAVLRKVGAGWVHFKNHLIYDAVERNIDAYLYNDFQEIGACEQKPVIAGAEGLEHKGAWGQTTLSEILTITIRDLEVTKANYEFLKTLKERNSVDFIFYPENNPTMISLAEGIEMKSFPEITGNDLSVIDIFGENESVNLDDKFSLL